MNENFSDKIKNSLKPSWFVFFLSIFFLTWQYFYGYMGIRAEALSQLGQYIGLGLGAINWNNYFIRSGFMVVLWIVVAFVIFVMIWASEFFSVWSHNKKIKTNYVNSSPDDYKHLLQYTTVNFKNHFVNRLFSTLPIILFLIGLFVVSGLIENIRFAVVEGYVTNLIDNNISADYNSAGFLFGSFFVTFFIWYVYAGIMLLVYRVAKDRKKKTEIQDEHFVVVVDDEESEDDSEENQGV